MKITRLDQSEAFTVVSEEAKGVAMRVPVAQSDGAPGFTMRFFEIEPGGHTPRHRHPYEHEVIVWDGSGTLLSGDDGEHLVAPGTIALVLPDEEHQFRAGLKGLSFFCLVPHVGHKVAVAPRVPSMPPPPGPTLTED
jgi:quercetin dioxygenase-like cupin family protein